MKDTKKKEDKFQIIRCVRCGIPNPYGSSHLCDEYDVSIHSLKANPAIEKWFKQGLRRVEP